jgi:hypothetical protein
VIALGPRPPRKAHSASRRPARFFGTSVPRAFIVLSGAATVRREWTPSATEALRLVREHMKLRRPGVRIEDETGNPVTVLQLVDLAKSERRERDRRT